MHRKSAAASAARRIFNDLSALENRFKKAKLTTLCPKKKNSKIVVVGCHFVLQTFAKKN